MDKQRLSGPLPGPDDPACEHSRRVCDVIIDEITRQGGQVSFDRFMQMALYAPGLGYYSAGAEQIGKAGDFVTAPVISTLFSECLAVQCQQVLAGMTDGCLLELGAGTGVMARDILLALERQQQLPACYYIVEISAELKQRQQQVLQQSVPHLLPYITWLERLPSHGINGVILANEVLDALPVKRIALQGKRINELHVSHRQGQFGWQVMPAAEDVQQQVEAVLATLTDDLPHRYVTEINPHQAAWISRLADALVAGVILLIDYGYVRREYYHPQRVNGTLLCHYRHRVHDDPFYYPGLQDITASVDFTALADCAVAAGLKVAGYTNQASFLVGCGLDRILSGKAGDGSGDLIRLSAEARQLILPAAMGERFKVIGFNQQFDTDLIGFSFNNPLPRL